MSATSRCHRQLRRRCRGSADQHQAHRHLRVRQSGNGVATRLAETTGIFSGSAISRRLRSSASSSSRAPQSARPGGMALLVNMRLPTGDRGQPARAGHHTTLVGAVGRAARPISGRTATRASNTGARLRRRPAPGEPGDGAASDSIRRRASRWKPHPKLTLLVISSGSTSGAAARSASSPRSPASGVRHHFPRVAGRAGRRHQKALLVPGLKVNVRASCSLSLNALITLQNNGLHSTVTPVVGIDLTM